jgi:hypothetical protein
VPDAVGDDLGHEELGAFHHLPVEPVPEPLNQPTRDTRCLGSGGEIRFRCATVVNVYLIHASIGS